MPMAERDIEIENYEEQCENEVRSRTGIMVNTHFGHGGRPRLEISVQGGENDWTYERVVQALSIYEALETEGPSDFALLLELYCDDPRTYYREYKFALEMRDEQQTNPEEIEQILTGHSETLEEALSRRRFKGLLRQIMPPAVDGVVDRRFRTFAETTATRVMERCKQSPVFEAFLSLEVWEGRNAPFLVGISRILVKGLHNFYPKLRSFITGTWKDSGHANRLARSWDTEPNPDGGAEPNPDGGAGPEPSNRPFEIWFAPSGSGKSALIFDKLRQDYGFYMVSGSIPIGDQNGPTTNMLDPSAPSGVSRDTQWLYKMLVDTQTFFRHEIDRGMSIRLDRWWELLILARFSIFACFCRVTQEEAHLSPEGDASPWSPSPASWLSFQLDCSDWDPFKDVFQVAALLPLAHTCYLGPTLRWGQGTEDMWAWTYSPMERFPAVRWFCFDEAQEDLNIKVPATSEVRRNLLVPAPSGVSRNLLGVAMDAVANHLESVSAPEIGSIRIFAQQAIFSGTSLSLEKATKTSRQCLDDARCLKEFAELFSGQDSSLRSDYFQHKLVDSFPHVMDDGKVERVLQAYHLGLTAGSLEAAVLASKPLRGRVKWTALYAERIARKIAEEPHGGDALDYSVLAHATCEEAVKHLWEKLDRLRSRNPELLDELLKAAISADILGRDHIFTQGGLELVEQGFAKLERLDGFRAKLCESVVIDAIIRYSFDRLNTKFMDSIRLAPETGTIGCPAERYLSVRLGCYLNEAPRTRDLSGGIANQSWERNRNGILHHLSLAENTKGIRIENLKDYALVVGARTIRAFKTEEVWRAGFTEWLEAIKDGRQPTASFLLPHDALGPDIVFALRRQDGWGQTILCSVQLKLGDHWSQDMVDKSSISWAYCGRLVQLTQNVEELKGEKTQLHHKETVFTTIYDTVKGQNTWSQEYLNIMETHCHEVGGSLSGVQTKLDKAKRATDRLEVHADAVNKLLEGDFWKHKRRLSLLIRARAGDGRRDKPPRTEREEHGQHEYFASIGKEAMEFMFGKEFQAVLDLLQS